MDKTIVICEKLEKSAKVKRIIAIILIAWNVFAIVMTVPGVLEGRLEVKDFVTWVIFLGIFIGIGVLLMLSSNKVTKILTSYNDYKVRLFGKEEGEQVNYSAIARIMNRDEMVVKKEVDILIRKNLWEGVYGGYHEVRQRTENRFIDTIEVKCQTCNNVTAVNIQEHNPRCPFCRNSLINEMHMARNERNSRGR